MEQLVIESGREAVAVRATEAVPELAAEPGDVLRVQVLGDRVRVGRIRDFSVGAGGTS